MTSFLPLLSGFSRIFDERLLLTESILFFAWLQGKRLGSWDNKMADAIAERKTVVDRYFTRIYKTG